MNVSLTARLTAVEARETAVKLVQEQMAEQKNAVVRSVGEATVGIWLDSSGRQVLEFDVPVTWGVTGSAITEEIQVRIDAVLGIPRLGEKESQPAIQGFRSKLVQGMLEKRLPKATSVLSHEQASTMAREIYGLTLTQNEFIRYLESRQGVYYVFTGFDGYGNRIDVFIHWVSPDKHHMFGYTERIKDDTPCMKCHVVAG